MEFLRARGDRLFFENALRISWFNPRFNSLTEVRIALYFPSTDDFMPDALRLSPCNCVFFTAEKMPLLQSQ
jgi:hypothetical protein